MATPQFVLDMRDRVGHAALPLVGVTAVVFRGERILLGTRADNGELQPVSGIVEPREEPADAAVREVLEEAGIVVRATRLAWVHQMERVTYVNGDIVDFLTLTFRCDWVSGDPRPVDGELKDVGWYAVDAIDRLDHDHRRRVQLAMRDEGLTCFEGGQ